MTIEKLNNLNKDFNTFVAKLSKVINATKEYTADAKSSFEKICDVIFKSDEEFEAYCKSSDRISVGDEVKPSATRERRGTWGDLWSEN